MPSAKKTLGRRVTLLLRKLAKIAGCVDWIYPVDTTAPINPLMVIGGFLSRRVRLVTIGRPLVIFGTKLAYQRLSKLVTSVESVLRKRKIVKKDNFNFNRAVFYVCPRIFRSALPLAGLHLNPDHDEEAILKWSIEQKFRGEVGEISLVGHDDGYDIYLVGAGDEPDIIERILREFCRLIEFPASHWVVVKAPNSIFMLFAKIFKLFRFWNGLYFYEKMAFQRMLNFYRREASRIKMSIKEGILD